MFVKFGARSFISLSMPTSGPGKASRTHAHITFGGLRSDGLHNCLVEGVVEAQELGIQPDLFAAADHGRCASGDVLDDHVRGIRSREIERLRLSVDVRGADLLLVDEFQAEIRGVLAPGRDWRLAKWDVRIRERHARVVTSSILYEPERGAHLILIRRANSEDVRILLRPGSIFSSHENVMVGMRSALICCASASVSPVLARTTSATRSSVVTFL